MFAPEQVKYIESIPKEYHKEYYNEPVSELSDEEELEEIEHEQELSNLPKYILHPEAKDEFLHFLAIQLNNAGYEDVFYLINDIINKQITPKDIEKYNTVIESLNNFKEIFQIDPRIKRLIQRLFEDAYNGKVPKIFRIYE